jgi:hypothetical protein
MRGLAARGVDVVKVMVTGATSPRLGAIAVAVRPGRAEGGRTAFARWRDVWSGRDGRGAVEQARDSELMRLSQPMTSTQAPCLPPCHPHPAAAPYRGDYRPLDPRECPGLLARLATVPDPRDRRGRRHPWPTTPLAGVLAGAAVAVLAGHRSVAAITEWATDVPPPVLAALGARGAPLSGGVAAARRRDDPPRARPHRR